MTLVISFDEAFWTDAGFKLAVVLVAVFALIV